MPISNVIKYEGDNETFVWKHPTVDFNTTTQLIVHESQEAILFRNGQALDLFGAGRYTLETQNIPLFKKVVNLPTGGITPFHCEVYFINKAIPLDMKWGTDSHVQILDPKFNILLHAGASGGMGVQIDDSRKFLIKLVGTQADFSKQSLINYFREIVTTRVKTHLTNIMSQVSFVTVNSYLDDMSKAMQEVLDDDIKEFGVKLIKFLVSTIRLTDSDYAQLQEALLKASSVGIAAQAEKGKMETLGYNWADQERAEIAKKFADNQGAVNNVGGMMAQMPMAFAFGQMMRDTSSPIIGEMFSQGSRAFDPKQTSKTCRNDCCSNCGKKIEEGSTYCPSCGKRLFTNITCAKCGRSLKEEEHYCPICGTKKKE